jgi:hypothetical protein
MLGANLIDKVSVASDVPLEPDEQGIPEMRLS